MNNWKYHYALLALTIILMGTLAVIGLYMFKKEFGVDTLWLVAYN